MSNVLCSVALLRERIIFAQLTVFLGTNGKLHTDQCTLLEPRSDGSTTVSETDRYSSRIWEDSSSGSDGRSSPSFTTDRSGSICGDWISLKLSRNRPMDGSVKSNRVLKARKEFPKEWLID